MDQAELIHNYNDDCREKFNPDLFQRSEDDIIDELKKIILSFQRDKFFTIKVVSFKVVDDYSQINEILYNYEDTVTNKNKKSKDPTKEVVKKKKENKYETINLKDSDIKLLIVRYFIKVKDEQEFINVLIAVPRIVDSYYFRLSGNTYSAMYQVVDASTYNNYTSTNKKHSVTLKTMSMPIRVYRDAKPLKTITKEEVKCIEYNSMIFNKYLPTLKYLLAKLGLADSISFLNMSEAVYLTREYIDDENYYTFSKSDKLYINTPKYLFDNDNLVQAVVHTIFKSLNKDTSLDDICVHSFWVESLGNHFSNAGFDKGCSVLDSLEHLYDISTKESIHLPEENKRDIYDILKWMMGEFSNLRIKDNLDISTKKVRCAEYIASLYAMKLSGGMYRVSDLGKKANLASVRRAILIAPMTLISAITKCQLVNYRNMINDTDSLIALKFTYKGISGIGGKANSVPMIYRSVDISNLGRVDLDSSSATDPGISGTLCPLGQLYDMSFSEFEEPNFWDSEFAKLMANYKAMVGMKEVITLGEKLGIKTVKTQEDKLIVDDSIVTFKKLINPIRIIEQDELVLRGIYLEAGERIYYE